MNNKPDIRYLHLYPSSDTVRRGEPLNVMFAVKNMEPQTVTASLCVCVAAAEDDTLQWCRAVCEPRGLPGKTISHIYMQIPAAFLDRDGKRDEFLILCGEPPAEGEPRKSCTALVFVKD